MNTTVLEPFQADLREPSAVCVPIDLGERSYDIWIGAGLWAQASVWQGLPKAALAVVVTNTTVGPLYMNALKQALAPHYARIELVSLADGEQYKDMAHMQQVLDAMLGWRADRKTVVFALGGGVVGDMAGFAAACYMRGVPFVQVPTTLLSQVDSSVGGKTGVNHPLGKNMIGAFYQPARVICDLDVFQTLPAREYAAGLAEVIKYGPIVDMAFFDWLEANADALVARDVAALTAAVRRSCEIKAWVVAQDEREGGLRAILNFGHTFGHAIETGMGYGEWLHGEGVAAGMVMAANLSQQLGLCDAALAQRLHDLLQRVGLPVQGPLLGADSRAAAAQRYLDLMRLDKKAEAGNIRFVLISGREVAQVAEAPDALVLDVVQQALMA